VIRINLLPGQKRGAKGAAATSSGSGTAWFVGYAFIALATAGSLAALYVVNSGALDAKLRVNAELRGRIGEAQANSAMLEELQGRLNQSRELERVVGELQRARLGPTRVLMEIAKILSEGSRGGPSIDPQRLDAIRRENPLAGYNAGWDSRRLWIASFTEEHRNCSIKGVGKTNEDVAEFLSRLALSDMFEEVTLERTRAEVDPETQLSLIGFELTCKVIY